jgi:hypothetical protein
LVSEKPPTLEDARLLIELEHLRLTEPLQKANKWFWGEFRPKKIMTYSEFKKEYPEGSDGDRNLGEIGRFFELAGVLVNNGILNEGLFFDRYLIKESWEAIKPIAEGMRDEMGEPRLVENFELLYEKENQWKKTHPPKLVKPSAYRKK